jgi:hypothetical protein
MCIEMTNASMKTQRSKRGQQTDGPYLYESYKRAYIESQAPNATMFATGEGSPPP